MPTPIRTSRRGAAVVTGVAALLALAACGSDAGPDGSATGSSGRSADGAETIAIVASTDVWAGIASAVGGDAVEVSSFIDNPGQDPHSYESNARNQLTVTDAAIVIENGGGYDDFMDILLDASDSSATVLNAVEISGKTAPAGGELNEHLWYDMPSVALVVDAVAESLGEMLPDQADTFTANADAFKEQLSTIEQAEADVATAADGTGVAITEPVPVYMLEACGLINQTPDEFSEAIEEGTDVSPTVLADVEALFSDGTVKALVYNEQTTGPETELVLQAAEESGVAAVPVTETLPDGQDYIAWMSANVAAISAAVSG